MKLQLHHINLCTNNVPVMDEFYRTVLNLGDEPTMGANRSKEKDGYLGAVSFVTDGTTQMHLAERDLGAIRPRPWLTRVRRCRKSCRAGDSTVSH